MRIPLGTVVQLFLAGCLGAVAAPAPAQTQRPNVIFILADDLGYGDLGCYGQQKIRTPNLDRMAAEGMRFSRFYAGSTVCAPSRSVLMTGLHTGHTRVRGNGSAEAQRLGPHDLTVARLLQRAGYATALVGKWGLGLPGDDGAPNRQGFDEFFGFLSQTHAHNHFPDHLWRNGDKVALPNRIVPVGTDGAGYATHRAEYAGDRFAAEALDFVNRHAAQPFFLYFAVTVPHANNERQRALGDGQEVPDYGPYATKPWPDPAKGMAAMITRLDADIGRLLERLQTLGIDDRTLVCFSSDNGPQKEGGVPAGFFNSSGPLRGLKRDLTEGGLRVPFIARWPGHIPAGRVSNRVGSFADFLPTAAALAGVPAPARLDGVNLLPTLLGTTSREDPPALLYWEFHENGFSQAVLIDGRWKGIRLRRRSAPIELYDLETDPGESRDLAAEEPARVRQVAILLESSREDSPLWPIQEATPTP